MIKSMTGFGRSEISEGKRKISVEMKSVNHRYLEAGIKMPKKLNIFEARIRDLLKKYAQDIRRSLRQRKSRSMKKNCGILLKKPYAPRVNSLLPPALPKGNI